MRSKPGSRDLSRKLRLRKIVFSTGSPLTARNFSAAKVTTLPRAFAHLENIGALLAEMLTMVDLIRFEVHGTADELEKLKKPLAYLNPKWFALEASLPL